MSSTYIPSALRERVRLRAQGLCEYCLLSEDDGIHTFQVDHVISEKHGGPTTDHNLAFCCPLCNRAKGSDIGTLVDNALVRFYNPRIDQWPDHFALAEHVILSRSNVGAATIALLGLNDPHRLALRRALVAADDFPSAAAKQILTGRAGAR